ncbi:MAG: 2-isopropylmalate synthase, partial [Deltaproteobacteria bacterium]
MSARLLILDTTLRGYKRSPIEAMSPQEKLVVARQIEKLGADGIEAGFPARSVGDEEGVRLVAKQIKTARVVARARAVLEDIEAAWIAVEQAHLPGIHTFIPTSDILLTRKVNMSRDQVIEYTARAVSMARSFSDWVQFSFEDATRTDVRFMCEVIQTAVDAGAGTINLIDSRGYAYPDQMDRLVKYVRSSVAGINDVIISVNCHDHLGLAVANSVAAARAGARQVECALNGIGERAGNAALEQIAMILKIREKAFQLQTGIVEEEIPRASRLISTITGIPLQPSKAPAGAAAVTPGSGEHANRNADAKNADSIMSPVSAGVDHSSPLLSEHSGRSTFEERAILLGYQLT